MTSPTTTQQGDSLTSTYQSKAKFPILDLDELLSHPKASKTQDMQRILTSPNSEDYVTWNILKALDRVPAVDWWPQVVNAARSDAEAIEPWDSLSIPPAVDLWRSVSSPEAYERASRARMRSSDSAEWQLRSRNPRAVEGSTEVDLVFDGGQYLVFVEAKLHSDVSMGTTYDPARNQIVRNIDCVLEEAHGRNAFFWMIVKDRLPSRSYIQLIDRYRSHPDELCALLPHREPNDVLRLIDGISIVTWSELIDILPDSSELQPIVAEIRSRLQGETSMNDDSAGDKLVDSRMQRVLPFAAWEVIDPSTADDELIRSAVATLPLAQMERSSVGDLVRGMEVLKGEEVQMALSPPMIRWRLLPMLPGAWSEVAAVTVGEMLSIEGIGVGKVQALIEYAATTVLARKGSVRASAVPEAQSGTDGVTAALREIAAWGHVEGHTSLTGAINDAAHGRTGAPLGALSVLDDVDLGVFAGSDMLEAQDPILQANRILAGFEERDMAILKSRVLAVDKSARSTLEQLGNEFSLTRERVRQLETEVKRSLQAAIESPNNRAMQRLVRQIRQDLGVACPLEEAPPVVRPDNSTLTDELFTWCAGPYVLDGEWLVRRGVTLGGLLNTAFDNVQINDIADRAALVDELIVSGMHPYLVERLIDESGTLISHEDRLARVASTTASRAILQLRLEGHPMTFEELFELDHKVKNLQSFRNALNSSDDIVLVGNKLVGLAEWGGDEYPGVIPVMITAIESAGGPILVTELADILAERYSISGNSIKIHASTNPLFLEDNGRVSIRSSDHPYQPATDLTASRDCFVIDGNWTLRILVDQDVLRGSGRAIPEAFAVHLGLQPLRTLDLTGPARDVHLSWSHRPIIGSIRLNVLELGLENGDFVFIRFGPANVLEFIPLRSAKIPHLSPRVQLQLLTGSNTDEVWRSWQEALSDALGYRPSVSVGSDELVEVLKSRRQSDLLEIIDELLESRS